MFCRKTTVICTLSKMPSGPQKFFRLVTILALSLAAVVYGAPLLEERAGGPGYEPIDEDACSIEYPLTTLDTPETDYQAFYPNVSAADQIYQWDLFDDQSNYTSMWNDCIDQCNYLRDGALQANRSELVCLSAFLASNVPSESPYLPPGSFSPWGCRMFNVTLDPSNLNYIDNGSYTQAIAGNIICENATEPMVCT